VPTLRAARLSRVHAGRPASAVPGVRRDEPLEQQAERGTRCRGSVARARGGPMKVLMFQPRFAPLVESGTKTQTIRPVRRRPIVAGDDLSLRAWTGLPYRSPQRVLREARCVAVRPVTIDRLTIELGGFRLAPDLMRAFALADGFADLGDLVAWFGAIHGLPFSGVMIAWRTT